MNGGNLRIPLPKPLPGVYNGRGGGTVRPAARAMTLKGVNPMRKLRKKYSPKLMLLALMLAAAGLLLTAGRT